ncbi:MAG: hypothetical protein H6742_00090 [Alphaproteobacteria bacterium]|nr:hypothetical protein [Alphaproteobacteria bacterium]
MAGLPEELVTYLRLSPEFGGTRFGPFEGLEVRLGSNPDRCHIVLPESLGVRAEHAKVIRQGPQNLILTPAERTATVFLYKAGTHRPTQLQTPTAVRPGDAFALVTADGPRFIVELDELPAEIKQQRDEAKKVATGRRRLSAKSMGDEVQRQAFTTILTQAPAQMAQRAWTFIKSGAIFQPRNIILGITMAGGWILGGTSACRISGFKSKLRVQEAQVETCRQELAFVDNMSGDSTQYNLTELAYRVTGVRSLATSLEEDDALRGEWKTRMKVLASDTTRWEWLTDEGGRKVGEFASWRERIVGTDGIDPDTARMLVWLAAHPGRRHTDFTDLADSEGDDVCGRGTLQMTYRQGRNLGLSVRPDALLKRDFDSTLQDRTKSRGLISSTLTLAGMPALGDDEELELALSPIAQGNVACMHATGEDDRERQARLATALSRELGPDAALVPPEGTSFMTTARLAKFWAADLTVVDFTRTEPGLDLTQAPPGTALDPFEARGQWVIKRTAETVAKAVMLPCHAVLGGDADTAKKILGEDGVPSAIDCLVLDWKLRNEE